LRPAATMVRKSHGAEMTTAAFQATYSDWRLIKGRKCVQIVFEVPVEKADEAYKVLDGMPDPSRSVWCAVARMNSGVIEEPKTRDSEIGRPGPQSTRSGGRATSDKRLVRQAAMCCGEPIFWKFLNEKYLLPGESVDKEHGAAAAVRHICGIESRSEILPNTQAGEAWDYLYSKFLAWKLAA
jgi:hypothetical protein